jgi:hypothetical protein
MPPDRTPPAPPIHEQQLQFAPDPAAPRGDFLAALARLLRAAQDKEGQKRAAADKAAAEEVKPDKFDL